MNENGEVFGPYWRLESGRYEFCITGNYLSNVGLETYAWNGENITYFETLDFYCSDSEIKFSIWLEERQEDFELHLYDAKGEAPNTSPFSFIFNLSFCKTAFLKDKPSNSNTRSVFVLVFTMAQSI